LVVGKREMRKDIVEGVYRDRTNERRRAREIDDGRPVGGRLVAAMRRHASRGRVGFSSHSMRSEAAKQRSRTKCWWGVLGVLCAPKYNHSCCWSQKSSSLAWPLSCGGRLIRSCFGRNRSNRPFPNLRCGCRRHTCGGGSG